MIFIAAGTQDGRELAGFILEHGYEVTASVVSEYGEELLNRYKGIKVNNKAMDEAGFVEYFRQNKVECFVDASHPYAANISTNAMRASFILSRSSVSSLRKPIAYCSLPSSSSRNS